MAKKINPFIKYRVPHFYHFSDRRNLPLIKKHGGLYSIAKLAEMGIKIPAPGGNEWSHDADRDKGLDQYVHLCFRNTHPMEYVARQDGRIGDTIFLQIHPDVLQFDGVMYALDVSNKSGVSIHPIEEAWDLIDFEVIYTYTNWKDPTINQRLALAEKCEILVPNHIPLDLIRNFHNG